MHAPTIKLPGQPASERDQGKRNGLTSPDRDRLKELERENRALVPEIRRVGRGIGV